MTQLVAETTYNFWVQQHLGLKLSILTDGFQKAVFKNPKAVGSPKAMVRARPDKGLKGNASFPSIHTMKLTVSILILRQNDFFPFIFFLLYLFIF